MFSKKPSHGPHHVLRWHAWVSTIFSKFFFIILWFDNSRFLFHGKVWLVKTSMIILPIVPPPHLDHLAKLVQCILHCFALLLVTRKSTFLVRNTHELCERRCSGIVHRIQSSVIICVAASLWNHRRTSFFFVRTPGSPCSTCSGAPAGAIILAFCWSFSIKYVLLWLLLFLLLLYAARSIFVAQALPSMMDVCWETCLANDLRWFLLSHHRCYPIQHWDCYNTHRQLLYQFFKVCCNSSFKRFFCIFTIVLFSFVVFVCHPSHYWLYLAHFHIKRMQSPRPYLHWRMFFDKPVWRTTYADSFFPKTNLFFIHYHRCYTIQHWDRYRTLFLFWGQFLYLLNFFFNSCTHF